MMNLGVDSRPTSSSSSSALPKSRDLYSGNFLGGLSVLLVDDNPTCLMIIGKMLQNCSYQYRVTTCNRAEVALQLLREDKHGFDIVISDVHMPDMDGFKLLELIGLEMDLPVIMMSADDSSDVVMKGIKCGACDYLTKPIRMEGLQLIWQHVVRRMNKELKDMEFEPSGSMDDGVQPEKTSEDITSEANEETDCKSSKKRKDEEGEDEDEGSKERDDTSSTRKRPRVVWSGELHQQFVNAVNQIGADRAVPKKILEIMDIPWLTRENIASHLQKYRVYLKKISDQQPTGLGSSYMGPLDTSFGITTSCNGLALQPLMSSSMLPSQHLPAIHAAAFRGTANKSPLSMPLMNQRNSFGYGSPAVLGRTATMHQSVPAFGHTNVMNPYIYSQPSLRIPFVPQMVRPQSSTQMLNLQSSVGQPFLPRASSSVFLSPDYLPVSQPSTSVYQRPVLGGNTSSFASGSKTSIPAITRTPQEYFTSDMKGDFISNNDAFNEMITTNRTNESNILDQTGFSSGQSELHTGTPSNRGLGSSTNYDQTWTSVPDDNSRRMRSETLASTEFVDSFFSDQFGDDDILNAILNQHQEGATLLENELNMDGFYLDNQSHYINKSSLA